MDKRYSLGLMRALSLATVAAILIQPIVFWAWFFLPAVFHGSVVRLDFFAAITLSVLMVSTVFVLVLGLPIFLAFRHFNKVGWLPLSASGFLISAFSIAIYSWPYRHSWDGYSSGGNWHGSYVKFFINGVPTIYEWLRYAEIVVIFGLHGMIGALIFINVWRRYVRPNPAFKRDALKRAP